MIPPSSESPQDAGQPSTTGPAPVITTRNAELLIPGRSSWSPSVAAISASAVLSSCDRCPALPLVEGVAETPGVVGDASTSRRADRRCIRPARRSSPSAWRSSDCAWFTMRSAAATCSANGAPAFPADARTNPSGGHIRQENPRDDSRDGTISSTRRRSAERLNHSIRRPEIAREMTSCWISLVPSKIVWILASRCQRSTGYSRV